MGLAGWILHTECPQMAAFIQHLYPKHYNVLFRTSWGLNPHHTLPATAPATGHVGPQMVQHTGLDKTRCISRFTECERREGGTVFIVEEAAQ